MHLIHYPNITGSFQFLAPDLQDVHEPYLAGVARPLCREEPRAMDDALSHLTHHQQQAAGNRE